jgi:PadR family transcriptional regulator
VALLKGTLDVLVLKTLSWGPMHAFEIVSWLEDQSGGRVAVEDAAFLQAVHRLEERKLLRAEWGTTKNARRARYYSLTERGRAHLRVESSRLVDHLDALVTILGAKQRAAAP